MSSKKKRQPKGRECSTGRDTVEEYEIQ